MVWTVLQGYSSVRASYMCVVSWKTLGPLEVFPMKTPERWRALPRRHPCQYSCPIDLLTQTFHILQQLIMTDRQRPFDYPNENDNLKVFTIITLWRHGRHKWRHVMTWRCTVTSWCYVSRLHLSWQSEPAYATSICKVLYPNYSICENYYAVTSWTWRVTSRHDMTSHRDVVVLCQPAPSVMTKWTSIRKWIRNTKNHVFFNGDLDLWPMTLTFELVRDIVKVNPSAKFWVRTWNGSGVRALTDGRDRFYTLDRWRGRE